VSRLCARDTKGYLTGLKLLAFRIRDLEHKRPQSQSDAHDAEYENRFHP